MLPMVPIILLRRVMTALMTALILTNQPQKKNDAMLLNMVHRLIVIDH